MDEFWRGRSLHAKWFNKLHGHLGKEQIFFEDTKFTEQSIRTANDYVESEGSKATKENTRLEKSLSIAVDIEKSLLENAFLAVFKLNGHKAQEIRSQLEKATKSHVDRLIEWREKVLQAK